MIHENRFNCLLSMFSILGYMNTDTSQPTFRLQLASIVGRASTSIQSLAILGCGPVPSCGSTMPTPVAGNSTLCAPQHGVCTAFSHVGDAIYLVRYIYTLV